MKKTCLVFGITDNYLFALANVLLGLKKHNNKFWDDIIIYIDKISEHEKILINNIISSKFVVVDSYEQFNFNNQSINKYSVACFYRYECFKLLNEYETVIWNDVDILIKGDISNLIYYGTKNGLAATISKANFNVEANFNDLILEYDMFRRTYNSGILVFHQNIGDFNKMYDWCFKKTIEYFDLLKWPDQGILNLLIQEFNINVELIDINKYCCHISSDEFINDASIIHAYGDRKFWNDSELQIKFPEWIENDLEWCQTLSSKKHSNTSINKMISCIMSVYDRVEFLEEAINSILNQTYQNFELIIVIEKSENQKKIESFLESFNDKRIVIVKNSEKLGFAESLNTGIRISKGEYIARMDDDDISISTRFERQVAFLNENPDIGICGTSAEFFGRCSGKISVETDPELLKIITLFKTPFVHPTVMIRKSIIDKYSLYYDKEYFTEDYELWSRAAAVVKFGNIDEILLKYRASDKNMTSGNNENKIHESHISIIQNQFRNYFSVYISQNEANLIQLRKDIIECSDKSDSIISLRLKFLNRIILLNKNVNIFNHKKLVNYINKEFYLNYKSKNNLGYNIKNYVKKIIKKIINPVYTRLMYRVEYRINTKAEEIMRYIDKKIENNTDNIENEK